MSVPIFSRSGLFSVRSSVLSILPFLLVGSFANLVQAQMVVPASDGTGTVVTPKGTSFDITGGTQTGSNLFHSFQQFGLNPGQMANFLANPSVQNILGRVTGGNASVINGLIQVSGSQANLYLMNPAGIIFGANASLNVPGSFVATTANAIALRPGINGLPDAWFNASGTNNYGLLAGTPSAFAFTLSQAGTIVNGGNLAVGPGQSLTLLGGTVINTGTLVAPEGTITVAAVAGEKLVRVSQTGSLLSLDLPVAAAHTIHPLPYTPLTLPQLLTGGNLGNATRLTVENGVVRLTGSGLAIANHPGAVTVSHQVDVSGTKGGTVYVLGDRVAAIAANIQASGTLGGGSVFLGGDFRGQGTVPNAQNTHVSADTRINARATQSGNGGNVAVWANQTTRFDGQIDAQGGAASGNGGFVEVSGQQNLAFNGQVNVLAAQGTQGTLLLDPANIIIQNAGANDAELNANVPAGQPGGEIRAADGAGADFTLSANVLASQLGNVILEATNNITIANGVSLFFLNDTSTVTFKADSDLNGSGNFSMDPTQQISLNGRSLQISAATITTGQITGAQNVTLTATTGDMQTGAIIADRGTTGNTVTLSAANGTITLGTPTSKGLIQAGYMNKTGDSLVSITAKRFRAINPDNVAAVDSFNTAQGPLVSIYAFPANQVGVAPFVPGQVWLQFKNQAAIVSGSGNPLIKFHLLEDTTFTVGKPLGTTGSGVEGTLALGAGFVPNALVLLQDNTFSALPDTPQTQTATPGTRSSSVSAAAATAANTFEQSQKPNDEPPNCDPTLTAQGILDVSAVVASRTPNASVPKKPGLPPCVPPQPIPQPIPQPTQQPTQQP